MTILIAALLSLVTGVALGLLGGGGSILTLSIVLYVLHLEGKVAIATSLVVVGTTSLVALLKHARAGNVRLRTGVPFGLIGMVGAYGAGRIAHYVPAPLLLLAFAAMMLVTSVAMLRGRKPAADTAAHSNSRARSTTLLLQGLGVGVVTGLIGAGGGFLVVPALSLLGGLPMAVAVGTSLVVIVMNSFAGLLGYLGHVAIDWQLSAILSASAAVGTFVGAGLVERVRPEALRKAFAWFVAVAAVLMLAKQLPSLLTTGVGGTELLAKAAPYLLLVIGVPLAYRLGLARCTRRAEARERTDAPHPLMHT